MPSKVVTATIANGATTSDEIDKQRHRLMAIQLGTFTGATITFTASDDSGGTFVAVYDDAGNAISVTATDDAMISMTGTVGSALAPLRFIKLVSASAEGAARSIPVLLRS